MLLDVIDPEMFYGGCSSVGRAPDCDSGCRGFEPLHPPQLLKLLYIGAWRSLVAHLVWDQGVVGSNPTVPTNLSLKLIV